METSALANDGAANMLIAMAARKALSQPIAITSLPLERGLAPSSSAEPGTQLLQAPQITVFDAGYICAAGVALLDPVAL